MSDIKIRAWDTRTGKMLSWDYILDGFSEDGMLDEILTNKRYIPMQDTGLRDKNGNSIYHGDILDIKSSYYKGDYMAVVRLDDLVSGVQLDVFKSDVKLGVLGKTWWEDKKSQHLFEIIGNIYENPELIK